eukprot:scaffold3621_cov114-Cylindrotheca_fusiformis.AAC.2
MPFALADVKGSNRRMWESCTQNYHMAVQRSKDQFVQNLASRHAPRHRIYLEEFESLDIQNT